MEAKRICEDASFFGGGGNLFFFFFFFFLLLLRVYLRGRTKTSVLGGSFCLCLCLWGCSLKRCADVFLTIAGSRVE